MTEETGAVPEPIAAPEAPEAPVETSLPEPKDTRDTPDVRSKTVRESLDKAFKAQAEKAEKPADETVGPNVADERPRNPDGTFAPKEPAQPGAEVAGAPPQPGDEPPEAPPSRFSEDARKAWASAPPAVRGEVLRALREMEEGLNGYQQRWAGIKPYADQAERGGTTLQAALENYTSMERTLRQDPIKGLELVCRNMGMDLRQVAQHVMAQPEKTPEQKMLEQQMEAQERQLRQLQQQQSAAIESTLQHFAEANPRFKEPQVAELTAYALTSGRAQTLQEAFAYATQLIPASQPAAAPPPAAPPAVPQPPAQPALQTSKADISLHGAPGSTPEHPRSKNVREAVKTAFSRSGLSL